MYKATLPDGRVLAVKRIVDFHQFEEQIVSELKTLGTLKHKNLLPLFGFCVESNTRLLVYKYASNGNLFDWIQSVKHRGKILPWPLRLKIAVGVARGLARIHHGCWGQVAHLNISSKCILLDRDFEPKLSNFGKAILRSRTSASGVHEFCKMAVVKDDVHGFGVVLLELITGMDCSRMDCSSNGILNEWIGHLLSNSYFHDAMDRFLIGRGFEDEILQLLKVACSCLDCNPDRRPTMIQVYRDIKAIIERCEVVDGSEIQTQPEIRSATSQDHKQDQLFPVSVMFINQHVSTLEKRVTRMSYADLNDATDSFSEKNVIGQGKVGILYKASLPNGYVLAVKKLHAIQFLEEQFISELKILGSLRHINLLPLLGFCIEQNQRFLVYEYMPNGNLYDWLHPKEESPEKVMEWGVRVKIAIGLARGLAWIHQNCHTVRVIHLDISSKCILLDRNFQPKLSNFGEAMLLSSTCTSSVNSELWEMAFVKEDVHGFGVVLLELITRVDPRNMTDSSNNILDDWTDHLLSSSRSYGAIDKSLIGRGFDAEIFQLLKVACRCVDPVPDRRPTMLQVYEDIKAIRERCELADDSENLMRPEICPATSEISVEIERAEYL
ncbi:PROTEIN KINASE PLANT-TYPE putative-RELATED [Salix koriyanagi]|uniref:PROTEIN KINASE PLANT-TYPE putative-RELATED n=1 Tax=Salix koriyanagi TaxID=2511006 RepID=A0A9Q0PME1_9ROSI|nr:PROTEIN KINASE PLANT-TYPE putative-RELATED [Salix koriyanagi]